METCLSNEAVLKALVDPLHALFIFNSSLALPRLSFSSNRLGCEPNRQHVERPGRLT